MEALMDNIEVNDTELVSCRAEIQSLLDDPSTVLFPKQLEIATVRELQLLKLGVLLRDQLKEEKERQIVDKPSKKLKLNNVDFNPSDVTWRQLEASSFVMDFSTFISIEESKGAVGVCDDTSVSKMNGLVVQCTDIDNEGFSMLYCGNIFVHIVDHLQSSSTPCKLKVMPVVEVGSNSEDKRKKCDYGLYTINNRRTILTAELKESVDPTLQVNSKSLAQLVLEILYAKENDHISYTKTIGVLASPSVWHVLLLDLSSLPSIIKRYCFLFKLSEAEQIHQQICVTIMSLMKEIH